MRAVSNLLIITGLVAVALQVLPTSLWPLGIVLLGRVGYILWTSFKG